MPSGPQRRLLLVTTLALGLSLVGGHYLHDQLLQQMPVVVALLLLAGAIPRAALSDGAALAIHAFLWIHLLGARYVYSNVPYDAWLGAVAGFDLTATMGWRRNHYDRLTHVAYGALAMVPQVHLLRRRAGPRAAVVSSVILVLAVSAVYEIFEWTLAAVMAPDAAERYNGQQGDPWDAQKDMLAAGIGAIVVAAIQWTRGASRD